MATAAPTIPALKQSFIDAQINILAQPLSPSHAWHGANDKSDQPISRRILEDVLFNLNQIIRLHSRRVYTPQASLNIAEQISHVYGCEVERRLSREADAVGGIGKETDLAENNAINGLPSTWPSERDAKLHPAEAKRYADTVSQLAQLNEQRLLLRRRVDILRHLHESVKPLQATEGVETRVQDNLVTRDGPVEKELERMRILLARVAGRVAELPHEAVTPSSPSLIGAKVEIGNLSEARKRRVDELLQSQSVFPP